MTRVYLVTVDSDVSRVTKESPLFIINETKLYVLNDKLLNDIKVQITAGINNPVTYETKGYIENGKINIDSNKVLELDIYKLREFMFIDESKQTELDLLGGISFE